MEFDRDCQKRSARMRKNSRKELRMKINQNMSAVLANQHLLRNENTLSASMERLSSGLKLNSAGDNPAGMAISNKMKAQIDALDQAEDNVSSAISTLQIADGALNEVSSILQRMRELSVQAANGTNSASEREIIQNEIDELTDEVDRISADTEYNEKTLLDGSTDVRVYADTRAVSRIAISDHVATGFYEVEMKKTAEPAECNLDTSVLTDGTITINNTTITVTADMSASDFYEQIRDAAEEGGCEVKDGSTTDSITLLSSVSGSKGEISLCVSPELATAFGVDTMDGAKLDDDGNYVVTIQGKNAEVGFPGDSAVNGGFTSTATVSADGNRVKITDKNGFSIDFLVDDSYDAQTSTANHDGIIQLEVTDIGSMTIQVGANQYQTMDIRIPETSSESLYLDTVNVTEYQGPERAMVTLDEAINTLNSTRSRIGALQNRLEYASNSLAETSEDMTSAYSTLIDTDMAEEMTTYTQANVLEQASISVLSQANDIPQTVLSLLQ
jgi:flagellin